MLKGNIKQQYKVKGDGSMREKLINLRGYRTQEEVGKFIGISQKYVSAIELGKRNPSIKIMKKLEEYFGVNMRELFPDIFLD